MQDALHQRSGIDRAPTDGRRGLTRLAVIAGGIAIGAALAALLPGDMLASAARFFDETVVEAFHGLNLDRFLCF